MAWLLVSLTVLCALDMLLGSAFSPPVEDGCATKPGFVNGSDFCCNNIVFLNYGACCSDKDKPGSCFCDGTQFQGKCAASPVAPVIPSGGALCPKQPAVTGRLIGGTEIKEACEGRGVVGLYADGRQFCNAVFAYNASANQKVLFTLKNCVDTIQATAGTPTSITGVIAGDSFTWDQCVWTSTSSIATGDVAMVTLSPLAEYFLEKHLEKCISPDCLYTSDTMSSVLNLQQCYIISHGYSNTGESSLTKVMVRMADITQCMNPVFGTQCFVSVKGGAPCLGDGGSPVYCDLTNGETALYGILSSTNGCSATVKSFNVLPIY